MENNPKRVYNSIDQCIGSTPMVRLNKVPKNHGVLSQIYVKLEGCNPGGSVKDRIGLNMILEAEKKGLLKKGDTIVESSSGNTGMGLALIGRLRGYKVIITIPDKMSNEKVNRIRAIGAEVIVCPTELDHHHPESYTGLAHALGEKPGYYYVDQYGNQANPDTHYKTTGPEIYEQMEQKIDYVFIGVGTGGTITGISRYLKEKNDKIKIIGIDPIGSVLSLPESMNKQEKVYKIEGIGQSEVPKVLLRSKVDEWFKTDDLQSFKCARDLISEEGIFIGGSCGSAVIGAINYLKSKNLHQNADLKCVVLLPDSTTNYLSKFLRAEWMVGVGFSKPESIYNKDHPLANKTIKDMPWLVNCPIYKKNQELSIKTCLELFNSKNHAVLLLKENQLNGFIDSGSLTKLTISKKLKLKDDAKKCKILEVISLPIDSSLAAVQKLLEDLEFIFMTKKSESGDIKSAFCVTRNDLLKIFEQKLYENVEKDTTD